MRHRLKHYLFDREKSRQKASTPSTFTLGKNPHLTKHKLHSKSTYFYSDGSRINYVVPSMCTLALLIGGIICINPALDNSKAYAEELDFDTINADNANNDSGIMTASDPAINLTITPDSGNTNSNVTVGEVAYFSNTITVGGTGISKYYLALSTPNGNSGNLVGKEHPASTVGKVSANTAPAEFDYNTWGYAASNNTGIANDSLLYNPVPSGTDGNNTEYLAFKTGAPATDGDKYKLVFAAKLGANMPSDHYQSSVYVSAVADAGVTAVIGLTNKNKETIVTMQEMSADFCANVEIGTEGKLIDARDDKIYFVAKLADHNCWMTQNLAYDGKNKDGSTEDIGTSCTLNRTGNSNAQNDAECASGSWINSASDKSFAIGRHKDGKHESQGNYYNWPAATQGGSGNEVQGVCPPNWQLPTSNNTNSKSFGNLTNTYSIGSDDKKLNSSPLYLQYNGVINKGSLAVTGSGGYYWSSTPKDADFAYNLNFSTNGYVAPSSSSYRYAGCSVRCVAK